MSRPAVMLAVKLIVSAALLALILMRVPFDDALAAIGHLPPLSIALAIALYFAAHGVNALKLRVFLPSLSLLQSFRFTLIALFYGAALPGQLAGDAVKAVRLMRVASGGDAGRAAAAVALDKIVGLFALLVLTALGLGLEATAFGPQAARVATALVALGAAGLAALLIIEPPPWLGRWGQAFRLWRAAALTAPTLITSLLLGLLFQALSIAVFAILGQPLGLTLSPAAWAVIVGLVSLALLLPVTVAGIGLRDASLIALLTALGQDSSAALALSLVLLGLTLIGAAAGLAAELLGRDKA